jgi:hypothetical protein
MLRSASRWLCCAALLLGAVCPQGHATGPCPQEPAVEAIVQDYLPAFALAEPNAYAADPCSKVVSGDFNGDGSMDYAAVLTERVTPRKYSDDSPRFSAYVFVFLASRLPYAHYQAVLLLGHTSAPRRINLALARATVKGAKDQLMVKNAAYSRTLYEWTSSGFVVRDHAAD